jgi:hypothetical protein
MSTAPHSSLYRPRYYVAMAVFMSLVVLIGFWPTYFSQILEGIPDRPLVVHLHGLIFVGWMVLLAAQVLLAATGRVRVHRSLGTLGIAYGFLVLAMGLVISVAAPVLHLKAGDQKLDEAAGFLIIPLGDMVLFAAFFVPAVIYRNRPDIHKRFIILATTALLFAAVGRMNFMPIPVRVLLWFSPVFIGMTYDKWTRGKVHRVYFIGVPLMAIVFTRVFFTQSEGWLRIGRAIVHAFA